MVPLFVASLGRSTLPPIKEERMPARKVIPIVPEPSDIRKIEGSFAWLDHRLLRDEVIDGMTLVEIALYVFLVLAADRRGLSFYRKDVMSKRLGIEWSECEEAKSALLRKRLIAFRPFTPSSVDGFYQVLSLRRGNGR